MSWVFDWTKGVAKGHHVSVSRLGNADGLTIEDDVNGKRVRFTSGA